MSEAGVAPLLVRDFINTYEPQVAEESLNTPDELRDWFAARGLMSADSRLRPSDLAVARTIREALRSVLAAHPAGADDVQALDRALAEVPVRLAFTGSGYRLAPLHDTPAAGALAQLVDAIRQAGAATSWARLKVCARDSCRWAFYDTSRNQTRRWCSMAGCGNRVKTRRAYAARARRKHQTPGGDGPTPAR